MTNHELSRRTVLRAAGLVGGGLMAAPLLSACGGSGKDGTGGTKSGPVTLDFWTHDPGYVKTFTAMSKTYTDPFQYTLKFTNLAADAVVTKMLAQAQAKTGTPDIVGVEVSQFPRTMKNNIAKSIFVNWTELLSDTEKKDLLRLTDYSVDGQTYGLESDTCPTVLYYRQDLFEKLGIDPNVATWEELRQAGAKSGKAFGIAGNGTPGDAMGTFQQLYQQRGKNIFDADGNAQIDTPEAVEVLQFMLDSVKSGFFLTVPDPYGAPNAAALKSEKLIATFMPSWYLAYGLVANVPDQKGKWRARKLPKFAAGGSFGATLGGTGFAVFKDKPGTTAGVDLVRKTYLTKEGQLLRFKTAGYLPTMKSLYTDPDFTSFQAEYLGGQKVFEVYQGVADAAPPYYQNANVSVLRDVVGGQIQQVLAGKATPADALKKAASDFQKQSQ
ncbi:sugar ABC transporter substrate-binding protein [Kribbella hippodromi]|uniref:Sugar ABC transporter substrate-binding protein n=1 Tax=Kribbella hippodromi TaxID=434347 RepID=A0ABN2D9V5_9ACTN